MLENINKYNSSKRGALSYFYGILHNTKTPSTSKVQLSWKNEIGIEISNDDWMESLKSVCECSVNARYNLIECKIVHRLHYASKILNDMFASVSSRSIWCNSAEGNWTHNYWSCIKLFDIWNNIFSCFSKVFNRTLEPCLLLAILGVTSKVPQSKYLKIAIFLGVLLTKRLILLMWKSLSVPTFHMWLWLTELGFEKIRFEKEGRQYTKFQQAREPVFTYLQGS